MKFLQDLNIRTKNALLILGFFLGLILSYALALSGTIEAYQLNNSLHQKLARAEKAPQQIRFYQKELTQINENLNTFQQDSTHNHEYILKLVSNFCQEQGLTLASFPPVEITKEADFSTYTSTITVEGGFIPLLKLLYYLEETEKAGHLCSVHFTKYLDRERRKEVLSATIYLQNINFERNSAL